MCPEIRDSEEVADSGGRLKYSQSSPRREPETLDRLMNCANHIQPRVMLIKGAGAQQVDLFFGKHPLECKPSVSQRAFKRKV